jgi:hypothetical protein
LFCCRWRLAVESSQIYIGRILGDGSFKPLTLRTSSHELVKVFEDFPNLPWNADHYLDYLQKSCKAAIDYSKQIITRQPRHNLKLLWKLTALDKREGQYGRLPAHFRDTPLFYSHADLAAINKRAMYHGGKQRHSEVLDLKPDNGERFFSQYLLEQRERNKELGKHDLNDRCQCRKCAANPIPLLHLREAIGSNQNAPPMI